MPEREEPRQNGEAVASDTLTRWYAAWNAHEVEAIGSLLTDDVRYEDPAAPAAVMHGTDEVTRYARTALAGIPDLRLDKLEEWVSPGGAVITSYFRFSGTFEHPLTSPVLPSLAPTGGRVATEGMDRSEVRAGQLSRHQIFWDMAELGRQMGFFPNRGSVGEKLSRYLQHVAARGIRARR